VRLRPANIADVPAMINLERQSPPAAHWSRQQYERLFVDPRQQPSEPFVLIAPDDDESEPQPENIVVAEAARRRGVGEGLLSAFIAHARGGRGNRIFLEVRGSNQAARALYLKAGFEEAGLRKSYYLSPVEDAILCRLSL
jgi:[ribosomal protein S18]-alanine N-acetyltransferase